MRETTAAGPAPSGRPEWLRGEVEAWVRERLIGREQAQMILARYGLEGGESPRSLRQVQMAHLISALGAVLVGVGVLLVVGANWDIIPRLARLALLVMATLGLYAGGYAMAYERKSYPIVGKALILLGSILWVCSIFLVAQMFHLGGEGDPEYAKGLMYGFIGLLPLAYVLLSPLQLALALFVGALWVWLGWPMGAFWDHGMAWIFFKFLAVGALLYAVGLLHRHYEREEAMAPTYAKFGIGLATAAMYALSFQGTMSVWDMDAWRRAPWVSYGIVLAVALAGALWAAALAWRARERTIPFEALACAALALVAAGLPFLVTKGSYPYDNWAPMIVTNVLLLALEFGCIWVGWSRAQPGLINWGLGVFFVHLMTRYFDLFADMLPTGTAFIGAGALLILGGYALERQRRHLLQTMPGAPDAPPHGTLAEGGPA